jgi:hypothetical protein
MGTRRAEKRPMREARRPQSEKVRGGRVAEGMRRRVASRRERVDQRSKPATPRKVRRPRRAERRRGRVAGREEVEEVVVVERGEAVEGKRAMTRARRPRAAVVHWVQRMTPPQVQAVKVRRRAVRRPIVDSRFKIIIAR